MRRILVIKLADIGDVLTATPALRSLRATFPRAHITALVTPPCAELIRATGLVNDALAWDKQAGLRLTGRGSGVGGHGEPVRRQLGSVLRLVVRLRRSGFDAVLLLHHLTSRSGAERYAALVLATGAKVRAGLDNGRGWFLTHRAQDAGFGAYHEVEYWNQVTGLLGAPPDLGPAVFPLGAEERAFAAAALHTIPDAPPTVALHAGSGSYSPARRWPAERFAAVAAGLSSAGVRVIAVGGSEEQPLGRLLAEAAGPGAIDLTGRTTLLQLGAVLERCAAFAGNDSGVMHIAAAVGTPVVAVFGPSNHDAWGPWVPPGSEQRAVVLRAALPCSPCFYRGHSLGTREGCPARTCLQLITPEQVVAAIREQIAASAADRAPQAGIL